MKFLIKNISTILFAYFMIMVIWLIFMGGYNELAMIHFVFLRDLGTMLCIVAITLLVYIFSTTKKEDKKFIILKKIYQIMILMVIINFSKIFAGIIIDLVQIVQMTFFSNSEIIYNVIKK